MLWLEQGAPLSPCPVPAAADATPTAAARGDSKRAPAPARDSSASKVREHTTPEAPLQPPPRGTMALPRGQSLSCTSTPFAHWHVPWRALLGWPVQFLYMCLQLRPDAPTFTPPSEHGKGREGRPAAAAAEGERDRPAKRARTSDVRTSSPICACCPHAHAAARHSNAGRRHWDAAIRAVEHWRGSLTPTSGERPRDALRLQSH